MNHNFDTNSDWFMTNVFETIYSRDRLRAQNLFYDKTWQSTLDPLKFRLKKNK